MLFAIRLMLQNRVYIRTRLEMHNIFATKQAFYGGKNSLKKQTTMHSNLL